MVGSTFKLNYVNAYFSIAWINVLMLINNTNFKCKSMVLNENSLHLDFDHYVAKHASSTN